MTVHDEWPQGLQTVGEMCKATSGALALLLCVIGKH